MNKKRITILLITVLVLAVVFLLIIFNRFLPEVFNKDEKKITINGQEEFNSYVENQADFVSSVPDIALGMEEYAKALKVAEEAKLITSPNELVEIEYPDFRPPGDSAQQVTQYIRVKFEDFSPKEIYAIYPALVSLSFEALDDNEHNIVFLDEKLSYLSNTFSRKSGLMQSFMAPEPGDYVFYIDKEENQGIFKVMVR